MTSIIFLLISAALEMWTNLATTDSSIAVKASRVGPGLLLPARMPLVPVEHSGTLLEGARTRLAWILVSYLKFFRRKFCRLGAIFKKKNTKLGMDLGAICASEEA